MAVTMSRSFILCYFLFLSLQYVCASQDNFFEHGSGFDDESLQAGNDGTSEVELPQDMTFPYYGISYSGLFVHTNGLLAFGTPKPDPQVLTYSNNFPLHPDSDSDDVLEKDVLIAPFWADVDTTNNRGTVQYRQRYTEGDPDIDMATERVRKQFPSQVDFTATWVLVVTWERVSFYDRDTSSVNDPRNTFQAVLITDSQSSFVFFYYDEIEWTCGTTLASCSEETGLTPTDSHQAIIGFNAGNGLTSSTEGFDNVKRTELPSRSNFQPEEEGSFAFQVNHGIIAAGCSTSSVTFVPHPPFGSILGGEKVFLYGPCWFDTITCEFWSRYGTRLQTVNGTVEGPNSAYCIPDPFFVVGEVEIRVMSEISATKTGNYRIRADFVYLRSDSVNLDRISVEEKVTREGAGDDSWNTATEDLTITWSMGVYGDNAMLDVHVLNYEEDEPMGPRWQEVFTAGRRIPNTGTFTFTPQGLENVTSANAFGTIRVQPSGNRGTMLYSDIHPLGYLLEEEFQEDSFYWAEEECKAWAENEDQMVDFVSDLDSCPCTLDQALVDTSRFVSDLSCNMLNNDNECRLHGQAAHCVLSIFPNEDNAGSSCCYDSYGNLLHAGDYTSGDQSVGGMSQRAHVAGSSPYGAAGTVPTLSHYKVDMMPFFYCCVMKTNCLGYLNRRPTADCTQYQSPRAAVVFGDPHFITFDGSNFTFNGDGDYTLLQYLKSGVEFRLLGRFNVTKAAGSSYAFDPDTDYGATGLTAVLMVENGADAILVTTSYIDGIQIERAEYDPVSEQTSNWEVVDFRGQTWLDFEGVRVSINNMEGYSRVTSVTVMYKESRIGVNVTRGTFDVSFLAATPILPPEMMDDDYVSGLLGNWNNNTQDDLKSPNREVNNPDRASQQEIDDYATTWASESTTLFRKEYRYDDTKSYEPISEPSTDGMTSSERQFLAEECQDNEQCQFDFMVTRNRDIARDTLSVMDAFHWARNHTHEVHVCRYRPTPENGTKVYRWTDRETGQLMDTPNNFYETEIEFKCNGDLTLLGSGTRVCQRNGEYSGSEDDNECFTSECGTLETVEHGSIAIDSDEGENLVVIVTCDEGYERSEGPSAHECSNGEWSGGRTICGASGGSNAGMIAGIIVGVIFLVVIIVVVVLAVMKSRKADHKPKTANPVKYSEVESKDMGYEDEVSSKKSGSTKGPVPAPRSDVASEKTDSHMEEVV